MQIHELNNFTGTLGSGAYLAIDDGTDTGKISSQGLLAATEARIDNIIAGPAPSAEEIVDARLGADGVTYPSLGDAIRDQFTDVKSDLTNVESVLATAKIEKYNSTIYLTSGQNFVFDSASTTRVTIKPVYVPSGITLKVSASGFGKCAYTTSTDGTTISQGGSFVNMPSFHHEFVGPVYFRLLFANVGDTTINPSDVTIIVHNQIDDLNEQVVEKINKGVSTTQIAFSLTKGKYINSSGSEATNSSYCYAEADLTDISGCLRIYSYAGSGNAKYAFYDADNNVIKIETQVGAQTINIDDVAIPTGAIKVKVNGRMDGSPRIFPKVCRIERMEVLANSNGGEFTNLLIPNEFTEIPYSWISGGFNYSDNSFTESETAHCTMLNVVEGEYYRITGKTYYSYNIIGFVYDDSITWIPNASNEKYYDVVIQIPKGVKNLVIQGKTAQTTTIKKATGYADGRIFLGKKIAVIGDSTVERSESVPLKWHNNISLMTGLEVVNLGVSGTGYKKGQANNKAYYQRLSSVPNDVDAVIIFGSGNDNDQTVGEVSDSTTDTVCGCVNKTINDLIALYPTIKIGVITAYPWRSFKPSTTNAMQTIANDIVEICRNNSIPVLDLYHCSNLHPWIDANNNALFLNADGIHINNDGHAIVTPMILEFIKTLLFEY